MERETLRLCPPESEKYKEASERLAMLRPTWVTKKTLGWHFGHWSPLDIKHIFDHDRLYKNFERQRLKVQNFTYYLPFCYDHFLGIMNIYVHLITLYFRDIRARSILSHSQLMGVTSFLGLQTEQFGVNDESIAYLD